MIVVGGQPVPQVQADALLAALERFTATKGCPAYVREPLEALKAAIAT